jgi:hypothetical protein
MDVEIDADAESVLGDEQAWRTSGEQGIKWFSQRKRFTETSAALAPLRRT